MSNTQSNKSDTPHRPGSTIHSTHACLETFDQATREQREHEIAQEKMNSAMSSTNTTNTTTSATNASSLLSNSGDPDVWHHPGSEKEANTAVQLDRDLRQSRRMSDSDRQKASGNTRSASWTTGLPYVE
ncbi:hypothetical protein BGZ80_001691 [Entomortierella chlamydospora]|uniref:Uncharacterized protein n=1 Tax=Entomortierella chlamydospora TaxID=101097 RepID=A0A9P6MRG7_9FUNG|nr:hypothetical protein BGZ79_001500 [Entomortierella chlamydospora]KAG0010199.1 hypothetical protein BGZ80_001691 [Entomortierella chlamydospora]